MITEAIITAVYNAMTTFLGGVIDLVLTGQGKPPGFHIYFPSVFWPELQFVVMNLTSIMPLAFGWWIWRGIKA